MSTSYHPETDSASERTNKTINQAIQYHVQRNQLGWVRALPRIRFDIMNSVNASTGFSPFQLRMGQSPRLIPPLIPSVPNTVDESTAQEVISQIESDVVQAKDNLLQAKIYQSYYANAHRSPEIPYAIGDRVMLSTLHRRREYKNRDEKRAAKFFPRFDGPYEIINVHTATSNYTLELPNSPNTFPTYHASELKPHIANDPLLFPSRELPEPKPILTAEGYEEYLVNSIIDSRHCGRGYQYLVRWVGYGPEHDHWLAGSALVDCAALDHWLDRKEGEHQ